MRPLFLLLLIATAAAYAAPTVPLTFTSTHLPDEEISYFTFPSSDSEVYYTNAKIAVVIEAVYVDGLTLAGTAYDAAARGEVDVKVFRPVLPSRMVYRLNAKDLVSARSRDINGKLEFQKYDIPMDAKKIEISYRVRYPDRRISSEMQLVSINSYEFKATNDK